MTRPASIATRMLSRQQYAADQLDELEREVRRVEIDTTRRTVEVYFQDTVGPLTYHITRPTRVERNAVHIRDMIQTALLLVRGDL